MMQRNWSSLHELHFNFTELKYKDGQSVALGLCSGVDKYFSIEQQHHQQLLLSQLWGRFLDGYLLQQGYALTH